MDTQTFLLIFISCAITMLLCRVVPLFVLKGRNLPPALEEALGFIPPAAFAALVANDLLDPAMFANGVWEGSIPLVAAVVVGIIALKTKSLLWCALSGVAAYFLLTLL